MPGPLPISDSLVLPESDLSWTSVRSSGPGGQNVNKVASKIELVFDLQGTRALDDETKQRLATLARNRIDSRGALHVISHKTRDRARNLDDAREKLRQLVLRALEPKTPRRPTRPSAASRRRRVEKKRRQGARKRDRQGDY
ncbi:MAG: aminoacyl-tRNA hydrolase [Deltaproteobacteria bacterium]|nr:aminoacyl-tRNA hydrolase [Deltaproteobacteria bacterium]